MDKFSGQSGTFKVNDAGERELVSDSQTRPHPEGDAPRDENGQRTDRGPDQQAAAAPQNALPEPAAIPPWAKPAVAPDVTEDTTTRRASRRSE